MIEHFKEFCFYSDCSGATIYVVKRFENAVLVLLDNDFYVCPIEFDWDLDTEYIIYYYCNGSLKRFFLCFSAYRPALDYRFSDGTLNVIENCLGGEYEDCTE